MADEHDALGAFEIFECAWRPSAPNDSISAEAVVAVHSRVFASIVAMPKPARAILPSV
jgi:hypothetical protein